MGKILRRSQDFLAENEADCSRKQADLESVLGGLWCAKTCLVGACRDWGVG